MRADAWANAIRSYPNGIPAGARVKAKQELAEIASKQIRVDSINGTWAPMGPAPITNGQSWPGLGTANASGRATAVAANPQAPHGQIWLGTASGGLWRRDANTTTWVPMTDIAPSLAIGAVLLDDCNPTGCNTVYAGTGENGYRRDTYYGAGIIKLRNGDGIWTGAMLGASTFNFGSVQNLLMDQSSPPSSRTLYVTLSKGETSSASDASIDAPAPGGGYGIYKSTDGGSTWNNISPSVGGAPGVDLVMDPKNPAVLYAAFGNHGIYKTTNGGSMWTAFNTGIPAATVTGASRPVLAISHDGSAAPIVYAALASTTATTTCGSAHMHGSPYGGCVPQFFSMIDDGAHNWQTRNAATDVSIAPTDPNNYGHALFQYPDYTHAMVVIPGTNAQSIIFAGVNLWKSTNGGDDFTADASVIGNDGIHPDYHGLVLPDPSDPKYILAVNDGGLYSSTDGGVNWQSENNYLQITEFQSIALNPSGTNVIGGTQDNGTNEFNGFLAWTRKSGGDSASAFYDVDHPSQSYDLYTDVEPRRILGSLGAPDILGPVGGTPGVNMLDATDPVAFYPPMVQAQAGAAPHPVFFATNRVYITNNIAGAGGTQSQPTWTPVSPKLGGTTYIANIDSTDVITALAVSPSNRNRVYIGYYSGLIFVTDAATDPASATTGGRWRPIGGSGKGLPNRAVTSIAVDPDSQDTAYVTFSGFGVSPDPGNHVYTTTNAGGAWTAISTGLSNSDPANVIVVEKGGPKKLWLGTDHGLFTRAASGGSWAQETGLPSAPVYALATDESRGRIFAGTHGRGAWFKSPTPFVKTFEGWVNGNIWDIPTYGSGFAPNQPCTEIDVFQQNPPGGNPCATGSVDAQGATFSTDANGQLVSSKGSQWNHRPVIWACYDSKCVGNTPLSSCNVPGNPISRVRVVCGNGIGGGTVLVDGPVGNCPSSQNPPSTGLGLHFLSSQPVSAFALYATLQAGDGSTRSLCSVKVPFSGADTDIAVLQRAAGAIMSSSACSALSVSASVVTPHTGGRDSEDGETPPARLYLNAPNLTGSQLVTSVRTAPGQATGVNFSVGGLGLPGVGSLIISRVSFDTGSGTAAGGSVQITERSPIGDCTVTVPTTAGESAASIAAAAQAAFASSSATCPANSNPTDVRVDGNTLTFVSNYEIVVTVSDNGVGTSVRPEEIVLNRPPVCEHETTTLETVLEPVDNTLRATSDLEATDPDNDPLTYKITTITQDEPTAGVSGIFDTGPDATITSLLGLPIANLRAENNPFGNGRVYSVNYTATDPFGASCTGTYQACVPNLFLQCIDDGQNYDSTKP